jgi:sRNA-binding protein
MSETPEAPPAPAPAPTAPVDCAQLLKQLFPALFTGAVKPLKLRIQVDIQQRAPGRFTKQALSAFFRRHTGSTSYLMAVAKATHRYDLDGQPSGEVSAEHRQVALDELARRRSLHEDRRAVEDQQRRNRATLLRDFESTTLTRANFCVLKGVAEPELDGLLERARTEAQQRGPAPIEPQRARRGPPPNAGRARPPR